MWIDDAKLPDNEPDEQVQVYVKSRKYSRMREYWRNDDGGWKNG